MFWYFTPDTTNALLVASGFSRTGTYDPLLGGDGATAGFAAG
jgi:hypothetical protein